MSKDKSALLQRIPVLLIPKGSFCPVYRPCRFFGSTVLCLAKPVRTIIVLHALRQSLSTINRPLPSI